MFPKFKFDLENTDDEANDQADKSYQSRYYILNLFELFSLFLDTTKICFGLHAYQTRYLAIFNLRKSEAIL